VSRMNNQQAINLLKDLEKNLDDYCGLNDEGKIAFGMAISALNCSEFPNNSDTINRQAAIDAVRAYLSDCCVEDGDYHANGIEYELNDLPSIQPEHKTGQWIPSDSELEIKCNKCGKDFSEYVDSIDYIYLAEYPEFCPNCGAVMKEGGQE